MRELGKHGADPQRKFIGVDRLCMPSYNWSAFRRTNLWQIRQIPDMTETNRKLPSPPSRQSRGPAECGTTLETQNAARKMQNDTRASARGQRSWHHSDRATSFSFLITFAFCVLRFAFPPANAQSPDVPLVPGVGPAPTAHAAVPEADKLMATAAKVVCEYQTIEAKMRQKVELLETQLVGSGAYAQQQSRDGALLMRLELKILAPGPEQRVLSFQQVCDGPNLWTYQEQLDRAVLNRVDMVRVRKAWQTKQALSAPVGFGQLGLGGIPRIIKGLDHSFRFTEAQTTMLDERPVYRLRGGWEPHRLLAMLPDQQAAVGAGQGINLQRLPKHVPWLVEVDLGQDDYFPYRISYLRPAASDEKRLAKADLATIAAAAKPVCQVEFYEVKLNSPLNGQIFVYSQTPNLEINDTTDKTLRALELADSK